MAKPRVAVPSGAVRRCSPVTRSSAAQSTTGADSVMRCGPFCLDGSLDGVAGGFGRVLASGWGCPSEGAVGELIDVPAGVLLEPVIVPALRAAITQACPAACFVRGVVLKVGLGGGPAAGRPGAGGVPDLGQVPQLDPGIVAPGLEPVIAVAGGDRVEGDEQVRLSAGPGAQLPGAVTAGRPMLG